MGRKKIAIARITDERNRQITFSKRKAGLLKKAYELSILCDCEIAVIMISNNRKLYQYASSNMNSILIRYTEFKDPDESKTNADILDDIQRKERGAQQGDDSGEEAEDTSTMQSSFLLTPHTQAQYGKMNEEFDHMLHHNQILLPDQLPGATGGAGGGVSDGIAQGRGPPRVMPVTVPVAQSPGAVTQQIQQHLAQQMAINSANSASSSGTMSSLISPQSEMSASPTSAKSLKSPATMPPPLGTPTRLQTLRNQSLKLHLPGSGRNYISLGSAGSTSPGGRKGAAGNGSWGGGGKEGGDGDGDGIGPSGTKPHLRVMIPGQKGFVARTQATSPLPQMELTTAATAGSGSKDTTTTSTNNSTQQQGVSNTQTTTAAPTVTTTHSESLTTPVISLATPNLLSALPPPLFSGLTGDFSFGSLMSSGLGSMGGGGAGELSSALVAFPVSIQPSSTSGTIPNAGNIVLQAQNMGQPFLLTPNIDPRQNPMLSQQNFTSPPSSLSPNMRDLEQLKHQYERVQQQLLHQQLFISQQLHNQQQTPGKEGSGAPALMKKSTATPPHKDSQTQRKDLSGGITGSLTTKEQRSRMAVISSPRDISSSQEDMDTAETCSTPPKRARLNNSSPEQPTSV